MSFSFRNLPGQDVYNPLTTSPDVIDEDSGKNMTSAYSREGGATQKPTNIFTITPTSKVTSRSKEMRNTLQSPLNSRPLVKPKIEG